MSDKKSKMNIAKRYTLHATRYTNQGFTLFIAVVVSSLLLAIGFSLASFSLKQQIISSIGKESQFAFYAADTGVECAMYWDFKGTNVFATSDQSVPPLSDIICNGRDVAAEGWNIITNTNPSRATTTFAFDFSNPDPLKSSPYCVVVNVGKTETPGGVVKTQIESRGYNTRDEVGGLGPFSCTSSNPRTVERAIRVNY